MTPTAEQLARWNTPKPDGTYPYPWFNEATDEHSFDVTEFSTPEEVRDFGVHSWGWVDGPMSLGGYAIRGPEDVEIDDHDEDEACFPSREACAKRRTIKAWIVEPDSWEPPGWYDLTGGQRVAMAIPVDTSRDAPTVELGL